MMILTTCLSGLLAFTLVAAGVDPVPPECAVLFDTHWVVEMDVTRAEEPNPEQADGLIAHVVSREGCEAELLFPAPAAPIRVGDHLRITGTTQEGLVIVGKVERLAKKSAGGQL